MDNIDYDFDAEFLKFYEERCRPLETTEFAQWFESWYEPESTYLKDETHSLRVAYLSERRFALMGWLARTEFPSVRNSDGFMQTMLDRVEEYRRQCEKEDRW